MTMKDSLNDLFRQRFQGHEAPVDPATWQVIEARLLTTAPAADPVNEIFRDRFAGHEVNVPPGAWQAISAQIGQGAASGLGAFGWIAAGLGGVIAVGGLIYALNSSTPESAIAEVKNASVVDTQHVEEPDAATPGQVVRPQGNLPGVTMAAPQHPALSEQRPDRIELPVAAGQGASPASMEQEPAHSAETADGAALVDRIITQITDRVEGDVRAGVDTNSATVLPQQQATVMEPPATADDLPPAPKPFMPNTFTPNNDGINDAYLVPMDGYTSMLLRVYSMKSNQLVFSTNSGEPWTGANCEDGWYMVAVEAMTTDGRMVSEGKAVWLNRTGMN